MSAPNLVDGDGWISDESDFYGDEATRDEFDGASARPLKRNYEQMVGRRSMSPVKRTKVATPPSSIPSKSSSKATPLDEDGIVDFLRTRPQIVKTRDHHDPAAAKRVQARQIGSHATDDFIERDRFKGRTGAWQQNESIDDFLRRHPVDDPQTQSADDGWLWVGSPKIPRAHAKFTKTADIEAFKSESFGIMEAFEAEAAKIASDNPGKAQGVITRKLGPYREQLESDLLGAAVKHGVTAGKWMLFPKLSDLPRYWRLVATATSEGKLGPVSKAATYDPAKDETLICIYTYDFTDNDETRRVLNQLVELGLVSANAKPIYYKTDAYTYLNLSSGNDYKLRASLYSSRDILRDEAKAFKEGPIGRLKKKPIRNTDDYPDFESEDIS